MTTEFDFGIAGLDEPETDDAAIDRWHDGVLDALHGKPKASEDRDYLEGYAYGFAGRDVRVIEVERPEGYYHAPLGTFD